MFKETHTHKRETTTTAFRKHVNYWQFLIMSLHWIWLLFMKEALANGMIMLSESDDTVIHRYHSEDFIKF
jgi:hypothetical protein